MQHMTQPNNHHSGNSQVQSIMITAITLFALAGAILGFSVGALTHHSIPTSQASHNSNTSSTTDKNAKPTHVATSPTQVPSPTAPAQKLGGPVITISTPLSSAYTYKFTVQATYNGTMTNVTTNGITCRLWITKSDPSKLDSNSFKVISNLQQTVPDEIAGGLQFDSATPQTQPCLNGQGTWNANPSASLSKGSYYIVGLTDWNGTFYNWSWRQLPLG